MVPHRGGWLEVRPVALILLLLLGSSLIPPPPAQASPPYSEELQLLFLSSTSHVFRLHIRGVNETAPLLASLESRYEGLQGYTLTAASKPAGDEAETLALLDLYSAHPIMVDGSHNLVLPGVRIAVRGDRGDTEGFVQELGLRLQVNLVRVGEQVFFGHGSFAELLDMVIWNHLPKQGLAGLLSREELLGLDFARVTLTFDRESRERQVIVIGLKRATIVPGPYSLSSTFPTLNSRVVNASRTSTSTSLNLLFVGSLIESGEGIPFRNEPGNLTARASLSLKPGQRVPNINITLSRPPPRLLAMRTIDRGSVGEGRDVEVTLLIKNLAPADSIPARNITVKEDWWSKDLRFVAGDRTEQVIDELKGQGEVRIVYRLSVATGQPKLLTQDPQRNMVIYSFRLGNTTLTATAAINTTPLLLNLEGPAVSAIIRPKEESAVQPWGPIRLLVSVTNYGNRSAFDIQVGGSRRPSLTPRETWTLETEILPDGLASSQLQKTLQVPWFDGSTQRQSSTNSVALILSHTAARLPLLTVASAARWKEVNGTTHIALNYTINFQGPANISSYRLVVKTDGSLKVVDRGNFTGAGGLLEARGDRLSRGRSRLYMALQTDRADNIIIPPAELTFQFAGITLTRLSNLTGVPASLYISRDISHAQAFPRFNITFTVKAFNNGTQPVFRVRISQQDPQVQVSKGPDTMTLPNLTRAASPAVLTLSGFLRAPGSYNITGARLEFEFAGAPHTIETGPARIQVHEPLKVTMLGPAVVGENEPFTIQLNVENRAPLEISRVSIQLGELPPYVQILEGTGTMTIARMGPHEKRVLMLTVKVGAPALLQIPAPRVSFTYSDTTLTGDSGPLTIQVREEMLYRYGITLLAGAIMLSLTAYIVRRRAPTGAASPR